MKRKKNNNNTNRNKDNGADMMTSFGIMATAPAN